MATPIDWGEICGVPDRNPPLPVKDVALQPPPRLDALALLFDALLCELVGCAETGEKFTVETAMDLFEVALSGAHSTMSPGEVRRLIGLQRSRFRCSAYEFQLLGETKWPPHKATNGGAAYGAATGS